MHSSYVLQDERRYSAQLLKLREDSSYRHIKQYSKTSSADLIWFPLSKRVGKINHTACILQRKRGRDAEAYWQRVTTDLERQGNRIGAPLELIKAELLRFEIAVQNRIQTSQT